MGPEMRAAVTKSSPYIAGQNADKGLGRIHLLVFIFNYRTSIGDKDVEGDRTEIFRNTYENCS